LKKKWPPQQIGRDKVPEALLLLPADYGSKRLVARNCKVA
jgi:hypothetical protein